MIRFLLLVLPVLLASCAYGSGGPPPLPPLAKDQSQPGLALAEHVLAAFFAENAAPPAVCITMAPRPLADGQEKSLIVRFPRLAPFGRCSDTPARVVQIYEFACDSPTTCSGWANVPGHPSTRYVLRWQDGSWRFAADLRLIER